jgi:aryl carrier-like protein
MTEAAPHADPLAHVEAAIRSIWVELLDEPSVDVEDDFFDVGGNSLLAILLVAQIRSLLGVQLSLEDVFRTPTIAALSQLALRREPDGFGVAALIPKAPPSPDGTYAPSPDQEERFFRWVAIERPGRGRVVRNVFCALTLEGAVDPLKIEGSLHVLLDRHELLRTTFATVDGAVRLIPPSSGAGLRLLQADLTDESPEAARRVARELVQKDVNEPFDYRRPPLVRARLVRVHGAESVLAVVVDHLLVDGWAMQVVVDELTSIYDALVHERPIELPRLAVRFVDYAHWRRLSTDRHLAELGSYWQAKFASGAVLRPAFPLAHTNGHVPPSSPAESETVALPGSFSDDVQRAAEHGRCTVFAVALAGVSIACHALTGREVIPVFGSVADRALPELSGLVGPLYQRVCYAIDLASDPTLADVLARTRVEMLETLAHKDLPFSNLDAILRRAAGLRPDDEFAQIYLEINKANRLPAHSGGVAFSAYRDAEVTHAGPGLALWMALNPGRECFLAATYRRGRYSRPAIANLLRAMGATITAMARDANQRVSEVRPVIATVAAGGV